MEVLNDSLYDKFLTEENHSCVTSIRLKLSYIIPTLSKRTNYTRWSVNWMLVKQGLE